MSDCARVHVEALDEKVVRKRDLGKMKWLIAASSSEPGDDGARMWNRACDMVERDFGDEVKSGVFRVGRNKVPVNMPFRVEAGVTEGLVCNGERFRGLEECVGEVAGWYLRLKLDDEDE